MDYAPLAAKDEELHSPGPEKHWQESWYFNWSDEHQGIFGLTRIGYRFTEKQIDGLIIALVDGKPDFVYPAVNIPYRGEWSAIKATQGLRARRLLYRVEEPMKTWRLSLNGRNAMSLKWEAFTPVFDFHGHNQNLPTNMAGRHFEQSGRVTGWTRFKNRELKINGYGHRDKSWGVRDWANVEGWNWISAQFGEELAFNATEGFQDGKVFNNGFVFINGENHPVTQVTIRFTWDRQTHVPAATRIDIHYGENKQLRVEASALAQFPLVKKGLWIQETPARFVAHTRGTQIKGMGVIEHAYHVGTLGALSRSPRFLKALAKGMF